MTIAATASEISYAGNGVTLAFAIPFPFDTSADLKIITTDSLGNISVLGAGFAITGGGGSTGTCTFAVAPAIGTTVTILDNPTLTQDHDYTDNDPFPAESHETALDRATRITKRLYQQIKRSIRTADGDPITDLTLGSVDNRKGKYLFFNAVTGAIEYAVNLVTTALSQSIIAQLLNPQTPGEAAALVTPVNYLYLPGDLRRYGTNTTPGTTDMSTAIQNAIDSADATYPIVTLYGQCAISKPLLIRSTTINGLSIVGGAKHPAILQPLAVDIKVAAQNVNCLIFNQQNNPHLRIENLRFWASAAYTGVVIYCKEGGGADASGQCLFSAVLRNIFCDLPSTNSGFLTGALQNSTVDSATFENMKGVFTIQGLGNADNHFSNISLYNCFDHFINQVADTNGSYLISISGLHAYNHNRGRLIDVQNVNGFIVSNVVLEPITGGLGNIGIAKLKDSTNVEFASCIAVKRTGVPQADIAYEIEGTTVKICDQMLDAAIGLRISGASAIYVELDNVTITNTATACVQINGAASGTIRSRGGKFNDSLVSSILASVANSISWYSQGDEFLNAGLGGSAGARNITLNTSGTVRIVNGTIGRNNGGAAAAFYLDAGGAGTVALIDLHIVGAPPTGFSTGAQAISLDGNSGTWTPSVGGSATYTAQQGRYTIINNILNFWGRLTINAIGTGSTTTVSGLPFNAGATYYGSGVIPFFAAAASNLTSLGLTVAPGANSFICRTLIAAAAASGTAAVFQNGTDIIFSGSVPLS